MTNKICIEKGSKMWPKYFTTHNNLYLKLVDIQKKKLKNNGLMPDLNSHKFHLPEIGTK